MATTTRVLARPAVWATVRNVLTGVGQIYLQESWIAGLLMVAGFAVYSIPMALLVLVGTVVATFSAHVLERSTAHGLQGYCGALVGAAAWTTFGQPGPAALLTLVGAAACPAVTGALAALLGLIRRDAGPIPVLTAPFCVVSGLVALTARGLARSAAPAPQPTIPQLPDAAGAALQLIEGILAGIGQVVFCQSWLSGLLILAGLFVAGWRAGLAALVGSTLGTMAMWAVGTAPGELSAGLAGYNPALTAIALSAVFLRPGIRAWLLGLLGALVTVAANVLLRLTPVPVYTWPFILVTWLFLIIWDRART